MYDFGNVKVAPGFVATPEAGNAALWPAKFTDFGVPEATTSRWVKISFTCYNDPVYLRIEVQGANGHQIHTLNVEPDGLRTDQGFDLPLGASHVSVGRLASQGGFEDTPVAAFIEMGDR